MAAVLPVVSTSSTRTTCRSVTRRLTPGWSSHPADVAACRWRRVRPACRCPYSRHSAGTSVALPSRASAPANRRAWLPLPQRSRTAGIGTTTAARTQAPPFSALSRRASRHPRGRASSHQLPYLSDRTRSPHGPAKGPSRTTPDSTAASALHAMHPSLHPCSRSSPTVSQHRRQ